MKLNMKSCSGSLISSFDFVVVIKGIGCAIAVVVIKVFEKGKLHGSQREEVEMIEVIKMKNVSNGVIVVGMIE